MKIALVGSMSFLSRIEEVGEKLKNMGHEVELPKFTQEEIDSGANTFMEYVDSRGGVSAIAPEHEIWKIKEEAIYSFKSKMDNVDAMLVCNFDKGEKKNRIGANTFLEMGYMFFMRKKIFILQDAPLYDEKIEEILGMRPIFLGNDLSKVSA